jgi:adenylate cyclase
MRFRLRPTIGNAIFALAAILIALMAVVATVNAVMSTRVGERIAAVSDTFMPVYSMLARAHIRSLEQSLALRQAVIARLAGQEDKVAVALQAERAAGEAAEAELAQARATVRQEVATHPDADDRLELGRLDARIEVAEKDRERYHRSRAEVDAALDAGDQPALQQGLDQLDAIRSETNANLEQTRAESLAHARGAVEATQETEARVIRLTFIALAIAVALGLLMASLVTRRLLGSFRHLLAATEAAERGHYDKDVPVNSQDEIGRLSRAFNQMLAELRLKQRIQDTFGRYVDPKVVKDLIDQPERTGSAGDRRAMTVAFADMQGFTRLSEDVTPASLVTLLNRYLTVLTDEVRARHGIVDKYIGDAVMSFWGPPFVSEKEHPLLACEAALGQVARFSAFRGEMPELLGYKRFIPRVGLRVGIATGEVIVGNVGSSVAMNYTVMGDAVNVASRLEGLNKVYGTSILVAETTARLVAAEMMMREVDRAVLAGRVEAVAVFEVLGRADEADDVMLSLVTAYGEGLAAYRARDWGKAEAAFATCLQLRPEDGPARVMVERVGTLRDNPPPDDWDQCWPVAAMSRF